MSGVGHHPEVWGLENPSEGIKQQHLMIRWISRERVGRLIQRREHTLSDDKDIAF